MDILGSAQNGLGNLADELADAWSEDEEEGDLEEGDLNFQTTAAASDLDLGSEFEEQEEEEEARNGTRTNGVNSPKKQPNQNLTPPVPSHGRGHTRTLSEYDGSDYGDDPDLESPAFTPSLLARMDMVEGLARRGTENNGSLADGVVGRVIEGLRDLGGQSGVEGNTTRYGLDPFQAFYTSLLSSFFLSFMIEDGWKLLL